jgi:hypothetical protein
MPHEKCRHASPTAGRKIGYAPSAAVRWTAERQVAIEDKTVWLHVECERFYVEAQTLPW